MVGARAPCQVPPRGHTPSTTLWARVGFHVKACAGLHSLRAYARFRVMGGQCYMLRVEGPADHCGMRQGFLNLDHVPGSISWVACAATCCAWRAAQSMRAYARVS